MTSLERTRDNGSYSEREEDVNKEIRSFLEATEAVRKELDASLLSGTFPDSLRKRIAFLKEEEMRLMDRAAVFYRRETLNRRRISARLTPLVKDIRHADETDLPPLSKDAAAKLARDMDEGGAEDFGNPAVPGGLATDPERYGCMFILCAAGDASAFLFGDDGTVRLMENNGGWQIREEPVLTDCFAEDAVMETDSSCLILNLDHGVDRLSYPRITDGKDLFEVPLYE